jgi:hypothetical protein
MKKVWVLEGGEYSDYHVSGIYSSRENAQLVQEALDPDCREAVVEYVLDPAVDEIRANMKMFRVFMLKSGEVERIIDSQLQGYQLTNAVAIWRRAKAPAYRGSGIKDCLDASIWAKDEQHAIKIVNEYRTQKIANGEWK